MSKEMLINVEGGQERRVAVVDNGVLDELYLERTSLVSHVGNIYKGKVVNIESGIQAAFIDFGLERNGFLHISDLHPKYLVGKHADSEKIGRRKGLSQRPPIQKCLKKGQEIVVQVIKEGVNTKGPTLTSYISLPGKYVVMMPGMNKVGVSQKIEDDEERARLKVIIESLKLPSDSGFIIRTAAHGATKRSIQNDVGYLTRLWRSICKRMDSAKAPSEIYQESDLVIRTVRDIFNNTISKIICDDDSVARRVRDFLSIVQPRLKKRVLYYEGKTPLFHKYKIENEIDKIQASRVALKSGGSIVIEQTEAMVTIDVNSGSYRKQENAEQTALKINIEAAREIVRQLKLRDMGGLIVCDFIDMREARNRREIEKVFREELKADRARSKALRISEFGLIELTRQRVRPSLQTATYLSCPHCAGSGVIKNVESQAIEMMRKLQLAIAKKDIKRIEMFVSPDLAFYLLNQKRSVISQLEAKSEKQVIINSEPKFTSSESELTCYNVRGTIVKL